MSASSDDEMTWDAWLWVGAITLGLTAAFVASLIGGAFILLRIGGLL